MKRLFLLFCSLFIVSTICFAQDNLARVIVIGAHPDDCSADAGGTAALLASMGHAVKFVSVTNGDAGHQSMGGGALARIRRAEAMEAGRRLGIAEYVVLDNHDGELVPSLDVRLQIIREIRKWDADVVMAPRPNDYHPDHRYTGILVQDAAYMVAVPNIAPDTPALRKNPVFLYTEDGFQQPNPFRPDITFDVSETFSKKIDALDAHESQMYDWLPWIGNYSDVVPADPVARKEWLINARSSRNRISPAVKASLEKWYDAERAEAATYAESFQICEYGSRPSEEDIRRLFPVLK